MNPLERFAPWWVEGEELPVALATATPDGRPSARMVLLKGFGSEGFTFFTGYESRKGRELETNPRAALLFHRPGRQVRVEGRVERLTDEDAQRYFETRARESRLGAWASPQSRGLADRAELDRRYAEAAERFAGRDVPLPEWWGGYRIVPEAFELWQNRPNRLHHRARYERAGHRWSRSRLAP